MPNSLATLEKIVEGDKVDDKFRRNYLNKKIASSLFFNTGLPFSACGYLMYELIRNADFSTTHIQEHGVLYAFLASLAGIAGISNIGKLIKAVRARIEYSRQSKEIPDEHGYFCFISGRISTMETAAERAYGQIIQVLDSLHGLLPTEDAEQSKTDFRHVFPYAFVDHVVLRNPSYSTRIIETNSRPDADGLMTYSNTEVTEAAFVLERNGQAANFRGVIDGGLHKELKKFLRSEGKEIALVVKQPSCAREHSNLFDIVKVYAPHP